MVAREAVLAGPVADAGVDQDGVANFDACHVRSDRVHDAHAVGADDPRRRDVDAWYPFQGPQIDVVERGGAHANADLIRCAERGLSEIVAKSQLVQATMRVDRERSHHILRRYYSPGAGVRGARPAPPSPPPPPPNAFPGMIPIKVPPLGESIVEATVSRWLKREGEAVVAGETVVELE